MQPEMLGGGAGLPRDGFVEVIWETLIAIAMVAAISFGVVSLAAHLNEARNVIESAGSASGRQVDAAPGQSHLADAGVLATARLE